MAAGDRAGRARIGEPLRGQRGAAGRGGRWSRPDAAVLIPDAATAPRRFRDGRSAATTSTTATSTIAPPDQLDRREPLPHHEHAEQHGDHRVDVGVGGHRRHRQRQRVGVGAERRRATRPRPCRPTPTRPRSRRPLRSSRSPSAGARPTSRITPPSASARAASANGLGGTGSRVVANVPVAQPRLGQQHQPRPPPGASRCRRPRPGPASTSTASPTTPRPRRRRRAPRPVAGERAQHARSRAAPRRSASAARPDGTACWASTTSPLPTPAAAGRRAPWCRAAPRSSGTRAARPTQSTTTGQQRPADQEPGPPASSGGTVGMIERLAR